MADALVGTVTSLESSVYGQVINRTITAIEGLSLVDITTRVHFRKLPYDKDITYPACIISPAPETSRDSEGPVGQPVVHYRVMVSIIRASNRDLVNGASTELLWREQVRQKFQKTKPDFAAIVGATFRKTTVVSGEPFIKDAFLKNLDAQFLLLDIEVSEDRV